MVTISSAEANTDKLITIVVPGCTTGTWIRNSAGTGLSARITLSTGSSFITAQEGEWVDGNYVATSAQTPALSTVNNAFEAADIGCYLGTELPEWELPEYSAELVRCRRLFRILNAPVYSTGQSSYGGAMGFWDVTDMREYPNVESATVSGTFGSFPTSLVYQVNTEGMQKYVAVWVNTQAPVNSGGVLRAVVSARF